MKSFLVFFCAFVFSLGCAGPKGSGTAGVEVRRGAENQAQIVVREAPAGEADARLVFEQGYIQAQDRFLQMDVARRLGRAGLAEIFGEKAVAADRRALGIGLPHGVAQKTHYMRQHHPEAFRLLESFSEGVNEYLARMPELAPDTLKNYRQITGNSRYQPEPWEPADSVAVTQNIAFYLSSHLQDKLVLGQVAAALSGGKDPTSFQLASKLDLRPIFSTFILDADKSQNVWRQKPPRPAIDAKDAVAPVVPGAPANGPVNAPGAPGLQLPLVGCVDLPYPFPECGRRAAFGSNNWVVSREFAGGDTAFLANDPHLRMTFPMAFYEGAYDSTPAGGSLRVRGFGLAGVPGVLIGHNSHIAWGMTNLGADVDDVYLELLDPESGSKVWVGTGPSEYEPLRTEKHLLKVRTAWGGIEERELTLRWTPNHGPVFTDHMPEIQAVLDSFAQSHEVASKFRVVGAYRWVGHEPSAEFAAILGVNQARDYASFREALGEFRVGAQNMVFAGVNGDIGYYGHGAFPIRPYVSDSQAPYTPVIPYMRNFMGKLFAAFRAPADWKGYRTTVPELYNPQSGRIVTANNDPFGHSEGRALSEYKDYFGYSFSTGVRAQRITELLDSNKGAIDLARMQEIQTDKKDLLVEQFVRMAVTHRGTLELGPEASEFLDRLAAWDSTMAASAHEPVLADSLLAELSSVFVATELTNAPVVVRESLERTSLIARTIFHRLNDGLGSENPATQKKASALLAQALEQAATKVQSRGWAEVPWGKLHRLTFYNPLGDIMPGLLSMPLERGGSWETVDVAGPSYGPNFRLIVALPEQGPIRAVASVAGGNYGMFEHEGLYPELLRWRDGRYRDLVPFLE